jgi:hypothetical protein
MLSTILKITSPHLGFFVRRIADRTCSNIVAKCLTARPATLNKVADVVLNFIEAEQGAVVVVSSTLLPCGSVAWTGTC